MATDIKYRECHDFGFVKPPSQLRVVVAMSGGVDSSVCAAWLARQGYQVIGVTLQLYDHGMAVQKTKACCAGQDIYDARQVAQTFGFAHYVLDYESRFKAEVIENFAQEYMRGHTPIPCVRCNQTVKFEDLLLVARELAADCLVTGHYIRRIQGVYGVELHRGRDSGKDQSYFLFATTRAQLEFLRFPLGDMDKTQTRALGLELGVPVAEKPDSQDICFVPEGRYTDVITRLHPEAAKPGKIVHVDGRELGQHRGIIYYTVGQRRGLGLSNGSGDEPLFVVRLDASRRIVVVGPREALKRQYIRLSSINWIGDGELGPQLDGQPVWVKLRSTQIPVPARFKFQQDEIMIELDQAAEAVTPGQACVFYTPSTGCQRLLGGGWIEEAI